MAESEDWETVNGMMAGWLGEKKYNLAFWAAFLAAAVIGLLPAILLDGSPLGLSDVLGGQAGEDLSAQSDYADGAEWDGIIRIWTICSILAVALPLAESILSLLLRGGSLLLAAGLSIFANGTVRFILGQNLSYVNQVATAEEGKILVKLSPVSMGLWTGLHVIIAGLLIWRLVAGRIINTRRFSFRRGEEEIDETLTKGRDWMIREFHGAIAGLTGIYREMAYPMGPGEILSMGNGQEEDVVIESGGKAPFSCRISYDDALEEYHLKISSPATVFLESGQPLGAERLYCLPRGTAITVVDRRNRFRLV